jgi:hypothetical protein
MIAAGNAEKLSRHICGAECFLHQLGLLEWHGSIGVAVNEQNWRRVS